jgi:hypothetical protein
LERTARNNGSAGNESGLLKNRCIAEGDNPQTSKWMYNIITARVQQHAKRTPEGTK